MKVREVFFCFVIINGAVYCQGQTPQPTDAVPDLWTSIGGKFNKSDWLSGIKKEKYEDIKLLREKCEKNAKENPFASGQDPFEEFIDCVQPFVNKDVLFSQVLMTVGDTTDALPDTIQNKFCDKRSQLKECSKKFAAKAQPCLSPADRPHVDDKLEAESRLLDYVCYNNVERVKRFINEGGLDCIFMQSKFEDECINELDNMMRRMELAYENITADDNLFERPQTKELCPKVMETKECVVRALGRCEKSYPSEFADSVLNIFLRGTPCKHLVPSDGPSALVVVGAVAGAVLLVAALGYGLFWWRRRQPGGGFQRAPTAGGGGGKLL